MGLITCSLNMVVCCVQNWNKQKVVEEQSVSTAGKGKEESVLE